MERLEDRSVICIVLNNTLTIRSATAAANTAEVDDWDDDELTIIFSNDLAIKSYSYATSR